MCSDVFVLQPTGFFHISANSFPPRLSFLPGLLLLPASSVTRLQSPLVELSYHSAWRNLREDGALFFFLATPVWPSPHGHAFMQKNGLGECCLYVKQVLGSAQRFKVVLYLTGSASAWGRTHAICVLWAVLYFTGLGSVCLSPFTFGLGGFGLKTCYTKYTGIVKVIPQVLSSKGSGSSVDTAEEGHK